MGKCEFTNPRIAYKSVRYFHFTLCGDGDALYFIRKDEILKRLFAELRIIHFDDELICTQMRDRRLTNPQSAYKAVRYFHFTLHRDGDAPIFYTQKRDSDESFRWIAYKSVRFFHFVLRRDGDAPVIIRKDEILKRLFADSRIN